MRRAELTRKTKETDITVRVDLDGSGQAVVDTGVGFMDHMLTHLARHGLLDLEVRASGDLEIDAHHTVEDVGICLGQAFAKAVGADVMVPVHGEEWDAHIAEFDNVVRLQDGETLKLDRPSH